MTSSAFGVCTDCQRPRKPGEIFCECGALLDYSASGDGRVNGKPAAVAEAEPEDADPETNERPPAWYQAPDERAEPKQQLFRVEQCSKCGRYNPSRLLTCLNCGAPMSPDAKPVEAEERRRRRSWRRLLLLPAKEPLPAGQHEPKKKPFVGRDPRTLLRAGLITAGALLLGFVLVIAAIKAWHPAYANGKRLYHASRERLFPRFTPHHPSSVFPPRLQKDPKTGRLEELPHPAADAFDRNLSTYWQSTTPRQVWDTLRINFKPAVKEFNDVTVFAGDPTATTIVPKQLQMTFYRWEPHPDLLPDECKARYHPPLPPIRPARGQFCVMDIRVISLLNTPAEQRFSIGTQKDVAQVVITVRGTHRSTLKKGTQAALTDIEFFDRH